MGPSGSGKTTLLNLLGGLDVPSAGSVTVAGDEITHMSRRKLTQWRARHVGFIFQMYNLIPVLTAAKPVLTANLPGPGNSGKSKGAVAMAYTFKLALGEVDAIKNIRQEKKSLARIQTIIKERATEASK